MNKVSSYEIICSYLSPMIRQALQHVSIVDRERINEIRIRINKPVSLVYSDSTFFLNSDGSLSRKANVSSLIIPTMFDIDSIIRSLCKFSIHSCGKEFTQGFFTIENGIRVGAAGTVSASADRSLKYINALNFRIARQIIGCADSVYSKIFAFDRKSLLICGGVNSGKTTLLRDLCRLCGEQYKIALIDERNELSGSVNGIPSNEIGIQTDVLEGYRRDEGIIAAIRTLSPHIIFCDEISTGDDAKAIMSGFGCGVNFVTTVHADSYEDLQRRSITKELVEAGVFDYIVILEGESMPGKIKEIRRFSKNV